MRMRVTIFVKELGVLWLFEVKSTGIFSENVDRCESATSVMLYSKGNLTVLLSLKST